MGGSFRSQLRPQLKEGTEEGGHPFFCGSEGGGNIYSFPMLHRKKGRASVRNEAVADDGDDATAAAFPPTTTRSRELFYEFAHSPREGAFTHSGDLPRLSPTL